MNLKEQNYITKLIEKYSKKSSSKKMRYALLENAFSNIDIIKGIEILLEKNITMSKITKKFEIEFAKFIGSKFALMVNSGSSANLLAIFALINPKKNSFLKSRISYIIIFLWNFFRYKKNITMSSAVGSTFSCPSVIVRCNSEPAGAELLSIEIDAKSS